MNTIEPILILVASLQFSAFSAESKPVFRRVPKDIKTLTATLERTSDEFIRAKALDDLLTLGKKGLPALEGSLSAKGASVKVLLDMDQKAVVLGQAFTGKGFIANTGSSSFWLKKGRVGCSANLKRIGSFGVDRGSSLGHRGTGERRKIFTYLDYYNPIRTWHPIKPKEIGQERSIHKTPREVGIYEMSLCSRVDTEALIAPRIPGSENTIPLSINAGIAEEKKAALTTERLFVLPDFNNLPKNPHLQMSASVPTVRKVRAGKNYPIKIVMINKHADVAINLERRLPVFGWYIVVSEKMIPKVWGAWVPFTYETQVMAVEQMIQEVQKEPRLGWMSLFGEKELTRLKKLQPRKLKPGQSTHWDINVMMPEVPGTYQVILGYEIHELTMSVHGIPSFGEESTASAKKNKTINYDHGFLYARIKGIRVSQ